jgi:hypothetical protein
MQDTKHLDEDDAHKGIPRDAEGVPIFLILPPAVRESYERQLAACELGWRSGETLAVAAAHTWACIYRQPSPKWLEQAIVDLAMKRRPKAQAKHHLEAMKRLARYITVRDLKVGIPTIYEPTGDQTWGETYALASARLKGTHAEGTPATIKKDYARVSLDLKAGRRGAYFILQDWRYRRNGRPDLKGRTSAPLDDKLFGLSSKTSKPPG